MSQMRKSPLSRQRKPSARRSLATPNCPPSDAHARSGENLKLGLVGARSSQRISPTGRVSPLGSARSSARSRRGHARPREIFRQTILTEGKQFWEPEPSDESGNKEMAELEPKPLRRGFLSSAFADNLPRSLKQTGRSAAAALMSGGSGIDVFFSRSDWLGADTSGRSAEALIEPWFRRYIEEESNYASARVFVEIKTNEILRITRKLSRPHPVRTFVCAQLLLKYIAMQNDGKVRSLLGDLADHLMHAIYTVNSKGQVTLHQHWEKRNQRRLKAVLERLSDYKGRLRVEESLFKVVSEKFTWAVGLIRESWRIPLLRHLFAQWHQWARGQRRRRLITRTAVRRRRLQLAYRYRHRNYFERWRIGTLMGKLERARGRLQDVNTDNSALEKRISDVEAEMARLYKLQDDVESKMKLINKVHEKINSQILHSRSMVSELEGNYQRSMQHVKLFARIITAAADELKSAEQRLTCSGFQDLEMLPPSVDAKGDARKTVTGGGDPNRAWLLYQVEAYNRLRERHAALNLVAKKLKKRLAPNDPYASAVPRDVLGFVERGVGIGGVRCAGVSAGGDGKAGPAVDLWGDMVRYKALDQPAWTYMNSAYVTKTDIRKRGSDREGKDSPGDKKGLKLSNFSRNERDAFLTDAIRAVTERPRAPANEQLSKLDLPPSVPPGLVSRVATAWLASAYPRLERPVDGITPVAREMEAYCGKIGRDPRYVRTFRQMQMLGKNLTSACRGFEREQGRLERGQREWDRSRSSSLFDLQRDLVSAIRASKRGAGSGKSDGTSGAKKAADGAGAERWAVRAGPWWRQPVDVSSVVIDTVRARQRTFVEGAIAGMSIPSKKERIAEIKQQLSTIETQVSELGEGLGAAMAQASVEEAPAGDDASRAQVRGPIGPELSPIGFFRFIRRVGSIDGRLTPALVEQLYTRMLCRRRDSDGMIRFPHFVRLVVQMGGAKYPDIPLDKGFAKLATSFADAARERLPPAIRFREELKDPTLEHVFGKHFGFLYSLWRIRARNLMDLNEIMHLMMDFQGFNAFVQDTGLIEQKHVSYKQIKRIFENVQSDQRVQQAASSQTQKRASLSTIPSISDVDETASRNKVSTPIVFWEFLECVAAIAQLRFKNPVFSLGWKTEQMIIILCATPKFVKDARHFERIRSKNPKAIWFRRSEPRAAAATSK